MATSTFPATGGFTGVTETGGQGNGTNIFVPEIWSDEILAAYKNNLVLANLVRKMSMVGKKGDTIHIPKPTRGSANAKAENTAVTIQNSANTLVDVLIDRHFEYSTLIEDIVEVQALTSLRRFHTEDAGYSLAKQVDDDLFARATSFGTGTFTSSESLAVDGSDWISDASFYNASGTATAYAADTVDGADVLTDAFIREMIQKLDDNNVPMGDRFLVVPPSGRRQMLGIDRYVSSDFVNDKGVVSGKIGNIYGVDIYVSSNCPVIETAANNSASSVDIRAAILAHKDALVLAEQKGVRSQTQYKQEFLGTLFTADRIYGTKVVRPESGFVLAVPN